MAADKECEVDNVRTNPSAAETVGETAEKSGWLLKRTKLSKQWEKKWFSLKERTVFYGNSPDVSSVFERELNVCLHYQVDCFDRYPARLL